MGGLRYERLVVGLFQTNCYLAWEGDGGEGIVIDPGGDAGRILDAVRANQMKVTGIVNTHGHADHIAANSVLKAEFDCPLMIHEADAPYLTDPAQNLSAWAGFELADDLTADRLLQDGDEVPVGSLTFKVIHTPGHTPGGICLLCDGVLFSGDTLFAGSIGRADFPGSSHEGLLESINLKLVGLPHETRVLPGHGPETTIGYERNMNPYL